tara:strand:- start:2899 stop:3219 length:321 start_codon:yes stop_codon:yes gene_type:complete
MKLKNKSFNISIGLGTLISIALAFILYKLSIQNNWKLIAFLSKTYLIFYLIIAIIILFFFILLVLILLIPLIFFRKKIKIFSKVFNPKRKDKKTKDYIDAEYKIIK